MEIEELCELDEEFGTFSVFLHGFSFSLYWTFIDLFVNKVSFRSEEILYPMPVICSNAYTFIIYILLLDKIIVILNDHWISLI